MANDWQDRLAGARMQVDQQFNDRVLDSEFSNQEWGLIMTAVEFDIENPERPDEAALVARTEKIAQIIPELENIQQQGMPSGGGSADSGGGLFGFLGTLFGGGSDGVDQDKLQAATALVEEYTTDLQHHLENKGRWDGICAQAAKD